VVKRRSALNHRDHLGYTPFLGLARLLELKRLALGRIISVFIANQFEGVGLIKGVHRHKLTFLRDQVIELDSPAFQTEEPFRPIR